MLITALVLLVVTDLYFVLTTLVDLSPLNNVRDAKPAEQRLEVAINAPIMLLPAIALVLAAILDVPPLAFIGAGIELVIVLGGLALWWLPYLVGWTVPWATAGTGESWAGLHERTYARTLIILPRIGERPRPNLEHMILHALMLGAAICTFIAGTAL